MKDLRTASHELGMNEYEEWQMTGFKAHSKDFNLSKKEGDRLMIDKRQRVEKRKQAPLRRVIGTMKRSSGLEDRMLFRKDIGSVL